LPFRDRYEAGQRLAEALHPFKNEDAVIFALPRGGVPVAAQIAAALGAPLDLVLVRKIGLPIQPELAMGAVAEGDDMVVVRNEDVIALAGVTETQFRKALGHEAEEIERRRRLYFGDRQRPQSKGRVAILVDDGIATGATTRAALRAIRARAPKRLILAVPVAPTETIDDLRSEADEIICLEAHTYFSGVGCYYADFRQTEDEEVIALLDRYGAN
jgi:putative phosphoribosyl transferase